MFVAQTVEYRGVTITRSAPIGRKGKTLFGTWFVSVPFKDPEHPERPQIWLYLCRDGIPRGQALQIKELEDLKGEPIPCTMVTAGNSGYFDSVADCKAAVKVYMKKFKEQWQSNP
jgi:hypothetical protein